MLKASQAFRGRGRARPQFLVDGMLGSLAVKLRILGFDTVYDKMSSDANLLEIARKSKRVLLTSDKGLILRSKLSRIPCVALTERNDADRLAELLSQLGISKIDASKSSRCSLCNGELAREEADDLGRQIYRCLDCHKKYWRGTHWEKLNKLFETVNISLSNRAASA